ncbi:MAG: hypothetical protein R3C58_06005 [Parvularculaceae bacterium]
MRIKTMLAAAAAGASLIATGAQAAAIGSFNGSFSMAMENLLTSQGHTVSDTETFLTPEALANYDIFLTALIPFGFSGRADTHATAGEIAALTDWLNDGGMFIITGEHSGFMDIYNSWLNPFGVTLDGVSWNYNLPVVFNTDPSDPYLANGVSGSAFPISNRGWYSELPSEAHVLAYGSDNLPFAFSLNVGDGVIIAVADTYFLSDAQINTGNAGLTFLGNAFNLAGALGNGDGGMDDGDPSEVPVPGAFLLMGSALAAFGAGGKMKRKQAA